MLQRPLTLSNLPEDYITAILQQCSSSEPRRPNGLSGQALKSASLICTTWREFAQRLLLRHVLLAKQKDLDEFCVRFSIEPIVQRLKTAEIAYCSAYSSFCKLVRFG